MNVPKKLAGRLLVALMLWVGPVGPGAQTPQNPGPGDDLGAVEPSAAEWEAWEKHAAQAGAGELVPLPNEDPELTSHQAFCANVKGWCPTVTNGVIAGKTWCLDPKSKCNASHKNRTLAIYEEFKGWLEAYRGGASALLMAGTIRTESEGIVFSKTKSFTRECGLASIDLQHAKLFDINACDPEANIWAMGQSRNLQLLNLREKFPQLALAPMADQWKLAGAAGAVGSNKLVKIVEASGALIVAKDGTLKYEHPHDRVLKWLMFADKKFDLYSWEGMAMLGQVPGKGAFRIARPEAAEALLGPLHPTGAIEWGEPVLPERPEHFAVFPGVDKHCKCGLWPEYESKRPL